MNRPHNRCLSGARQTASRHLTGGQITAHGPKPTRRFSDEFPKSLLNALEDARLSINHGGLTEFGGLWVGEHSECMREHRGSVIDRLCTDDLLDRLGRAPERTATITETGLMTLDLLGER